MTEFGILELLGSFSREIFLNKRNRALFLRLLFLFMLTFSACYRIDAPFPYDHKKVSISSLYMVDDRSSNEEYDVTSYSKEGVGPRAKGCNLLLSGETASGGSIRWNLFVSDELKESIERQSLANPIQKNWKHIVSKMDETLSLVFGPDRPRFVLDVLLVSKGHSVRQVVSGKNHDAVPLSFAFVIDDSSQDAARRSLSECGPTLTHEMAHICLVRVPGSGDAWKTWKRRDKKGEHFSEEVVICTVEYLSAALMGGELYITISGPAYKKAQSLDYFPEDKWEQMTPAKLYFYSRNIAILNIAHHLRTTQVTTEEQAKQLIQLAKEMVRHPFDYRTGFFPFTGNANEVLSGP